MGPWPMAKEANGSQGFTRDGSNASSLSHEVALPFRSFPGGPTAGASE